MKRTGIITLGVLAVTAIACNEKSPDIRHCVNEDGVVVDESLCHPLDATDAGVDDAGTVTTDDAGIPIVVPPHSAGNPVIFYRWYYGGYSRPLIPGERVIINGNGYGGFRPSIGHSYSSPSTFSRGGFGGAGHSFGGGGGE